MRLPCYRIRGGASHDDLHYAFGVVIIMPIRSQRANSFVKLITNSTAHADDHRLAVHHLKSSAINPRRLSEPTTASSAAHFVLSFSLCSTSSPSVASSKSGSIIGFS